MKVYTRTGDNGTTSLVGGTRVAKTNPRLEAYGTVDELNSHIGLLIAIMPKPQPETLTWVQNRLFDLGAMLATEPESKFQPKSLADEDIECLERDIDDMQARLPELRAFVLPGGTVPAAQANVARTVCRRAERRMLALAEQGIPVAPAALRFINRLSDYLFVLSRCLNVAAGQPEIIWG